MISKIRFVILFALIIASVVSVARTALDIYSRSKNLKALEGDVASLEKEQEELKKKLREAETDAFVEKEARERLGYVKPGEKIVIVPKQKESSERQSVLGDFSSAEKIPCWRKWKKLLLW